MDDRATINEELRTLTERLVVTLARLSERNERLERLADDYEHALRTADTPSLAACVSSQNEAIQEIATLDQERDALVRELGLRLGIPPGGRLRITELAERLPGELRERLLRVATPLRESLERLGERHELLKQATEQIAGHVEGLMRQVASASSHAGTYGRRGSVESGTGVITALDVRS